MTSRFLTFLVAGAVLALAALPLRAAEFADLPPLAEGQEEAIFAGGCFWCVESDFDKIPGVLATTSGYIGGDVERPSYRQVTFSETGHYEAVRVLYNPEVVSYDDLLTAFWRSVDPTDDGGQFCDRGTSYLTAVFPVDADQRAAAEASKLAAAGDVDISDPIVTPILDATPFYPAEVYHQDYYTKKPLSYQYYRYRCGRDARVREVWGEEAFMGIPKKE